MNFEVGLRVRLKVTHRIAGTIAEIDTSARELCRADLVAIVLDDHGPRPVPYFSDELEPETPCDCAWCVSRYALRGPS